MATSCGMSVLFGHFAPASRPLFVITNLRLSGSTSPRLGDQPVRGNVRTPGFAATGRLRIHAAKVDKLHAKSRNRPHSIAAPPCKRRWSCFQLCRLLYSLLRRRALSFARRHCSGLSLSGVHRRALFRGTAVRYRHHWGISQRACISGPCRCRCIRDPR